MPNGYLGKILRVDLDRGTSEAETPDDAFYRAYMGGGAIGAYYLLRETAPGTDPLSPDNVLTIAPGVTTGARVSGASRCSVTALSPLTGGAGDGQAGGDLGPALKRAGWDAIVIRGRAPRQSYLLVDGDRVELRDAAHLTGRTVSEAWGALTEEHGERDTCVLQCGPAGEAQVRWACLAAGRNDVIGRNGLGAVFGSKGLRAVVIRGTGELPFADAEGLKALNRLAAKRLETVGFLHGLRKEGTAGLVKIQADAGNLSTHNFSRGWHPEAKSLDAEAFDAELGAGDTTCFGCVVRCRKRVRAEAPVELSDALGAPEFETLGLLGTNLDLTDIGVVAKASERCNELGLDTITTGGMAAWLFEAFEAGHVPAEALGGRRVGFGDGEALLWLIERIARREGIGDLLADGFEAAISRFGEATRPFAIQVKGQPLAAHLPQVKPAMALMYAVCPTGADHMSCEHDWLLGSSGEDRKGLAIAAGGDARSANLAKTRMIAYSQLYYSLCDTLPLCLFVWAPGSMYTYRELEDLVRAATGWHCTLWELMKVGERRVNMMRQLNARRGFSREQDRLPARLSDPLPDGPSAGRRVDPEAQARMQDEYYGLMGWDVGTGNPTVGKLQELGLEWSLE